MNRATSPTGWARNPDGSPGYTWNPITGCLNHDNGLCKGGGFPCYAYKLANGRLKPLYLANRNLPFPMIGDELLKTYQDPFYPRFWEERLYHDWGQKRGIFVCDMGELFGDWIPRKWQEDIFRLIRLHKGNRYYLLTKQPQNLIKFSPFPDNAWVGVTATSGKMVDDAGYYLEKIEAKVKFLSVEPLLESMLLFFGKPTLDWLIIGACTGTYSELWHLAGRLYHLKEEQDFVRAMQIKELSKGRYTLQPSIAWVREIVEAADKAGVKVFLKDNLKPLLVETKDSNEYAPLWANSGYGTLRQELPNQEDNG